MRRLYGTMCYSTAKFAKETQTGHPGKKWAILPNVLKSDRILQETQLCDAPPVSMEHVHRVHCSQYILRFLQGKMSDRELRKIGVSYSSEMVSRVIHVTGGTVQAAFDVVSGKFDAVANLAGGLLNGSQLLSCYDLVDCNFQHYRGSSCSL